MASLWPWILAALAAYIVYLFFKHLHVIYQQKSFKVPAVISFLPWVGSGLSFIGNPRAFFEGHRDDLGDTFTVYLFGVRMLCMFGPQGVGSLYKLREKDASFTEATKGLLSLKLPKELLADNSLMKFHKGLKPALLPFYLTYAKESVSKALADLPNEQHVVDLFPYIKNLVHRIGMACWVTPAAATDPYFGQLVTAYEDLDPESGFQDLSKFVFTMLSGKMYEKAAITTMTKVLKQLWQAEAHLFTESSVPRNDNLTELHSLYLELPEEERYRRVAIDVFHFQLASQANMYAGIAWSLVRLLTTDDDLHLERVRKEIDHVRGQHGPNFLTDVNALTDMVYLEAVILESLRLAQQSITLRKVMQPCAIQDEDGADVNVPPGWTLATLLSVTNMDARGMVRDGAGAVTSSQPTADRDAVATAPLDTFRPERYVACPDNLSVAASIAQGRLSRREGTANVLSSTFGHGSHACPGRNFALSISKLVVVTLLQELELEPQFTTAVVPPSSVGALARVEGQCLVGLKPKKRSVYV
eukprot:m.117273 g.117273  ORF g.117273 m.117273 type:complete len:529 (+) comp15542_c0_seq3:1429-3015(+)